MLKKSVKSPQFMLANGDDKHIKLSSKNENDFTNSVATKNLSCKVKPSVHANVSWGLTLVKMQLFIGEGKEDVDGERWVAQRAHR